MSATGQCCECYKKLKSVGVPLYIQEESDEFGEDGKEISYNGAFRLPGIMTIDDRVEEYPMVEDSELFIVFQKMAQIIKNLEDYETNVLSFWILDMFIEGLHTAQNAKMNHSHQRATLLWIAYFFNYLQLNNISRIEMFNHLKKLLFSSCGPLELEEESNSVSSSENIREEENLEAEGPSSPEKIWELPLPPVLTEDGELKAEEYFSKNGSAEMTSDGEEYLSDSEKEISSEVNVEHTNVIMEILYRIFGRLWVFQEIQAVFHSMPLAEIVDLPFSIQTPKPVLKPDSPYYQKYFKHSLEDIEEIRFNKNDFILPLQFSEEAKFYTDQVSRSLQTQSHSDSFASQGKPKVDKKK